MGSLTATPPPESDETLPSYLLRVAERNGLPVGALTKRMLSGRRTPGPLLSVRPEDIDGAAAVLDLTQSQFSLLLVQPPGTESPNAYWLDHSGRARLPLWGVTSHFSRGCAPCLADHGSWRRVWRLELVTVCVDHGTYLQHRCQICGSRWFADPEEGAKRRLARPYRLDEVPLEPGRCHATPTTPDDEVYWCNAVIQGPPATPSTALLHATAKLQAHWPFDDHHWERHREMRFALRRQLPHGENAEITHEYAEAALDVLT